MKSKHIFSDLLLYVCIAAIFGMGSCKDPIYPEIDKPDPTRSGINDIVSFHLDLSQFPEYTEGDAANVVIVPEADSIYIEVPWYAGIIMAPEITVSSNATIAPISGSVRDFSQGTVIYTVRANNGDKKEWKVYVKWLDEPEPPLSDDPRRPLEENDKYKIHKIPIYSNAYTISGTGMSLSSTNGITWTTSGATGLGSIYFNVRYHGELQLALRGRAGNATGGTLRVRIYVNEEQYVENGEPYDHAYLYKKTNQTTDTLTIHRIHLPEVPQGHAGHTVRIDLSVEGARNGSYYFRFPELWVSGWATRGTGGKDLTGLNWVPLTNEHFGRRGPSVHINIEKPAGNMEYFYSEVFIPEGQDKLGSYFMCNGFGQGYAGIQVNSATQRRVLFSVWSAYTTDNPAQMGKYAPRLVRVNNDAAFRNTITYTKFGGEGSGGQSYMVYPWVAGQTYKMLTRVRPHPQPEKFPNSSLYKTWFHDGEKWIFIAEWRRIELDAADNNGVAPTTNWYTGAHHFLENFTPNEGNKTRYGTWNNDWYISADGEWYESANYTFTNDATASAGDRVDYAGGILPPGDPQAGAVFLKMGGYFTDNVPAQTRFVKSLRNDRPAIDFAALNAMGTDDPAADTMVDVGEQYEE
ncbi:MAG: DUF3472 domain-containing protein [Prevotellaceae bacterium]|jgi:hypothetical protein|nr:DUF3472 domain-containing protein [Prevotellaceae bacterium]